MTLNNRNSGFHLLHRKRGDILHFHIFGEIDAQTERIACWQEITAIAKREGADKVLIHNCKKKTAAGPEELAQLLAIARNWNTTINCVAVVEPITKFISAAQHLEILGQEAGLNIRIFNFEDEAERWLKYGMQDETRHSSLCQIATTATSTMNVSTYHLARLIAA